MCQIDPMHYKANNFIRNSLLFILSKIILFFTILSMPFALAAQDNIANKANANDSLKLKEINDFRYQKDLTDIALLILHRDPNKRIDSIKGKSEKLNFSASPILEYTLSTGLTVGIAASGAFYTSVKNQTNISSLLGAVKYTEKKQFLLPIQTSLWTPGNKYNFLGDWRYLNFPQDTYGIGSLTATTDKYIIAYKYLRFYEFILKNISKNFYLGMGYQLDHHWGIKEIGVLPGRITDYKLYGFNQNSTSSGVSFNVVHDSRKNSINPEGGSVYGNVQFLQNSRLLGSQSNWNSLLIDLRKYFKIGQKNVLGFWFYSVLTLSGNPPYLDLPGAGSDMYNNSGRGYEQGRFIGKKYIDLEAEFRFGITNNGLIGGIIFCNAGSVSELRTNKFESIFSGVGAGLRIKLNKFSNTNTCLDFGFGRNKSKGFFGNLGEVF